MLQKQLTHSLFYSKFVGLILKNKKYETQIESRISVYTKFYSAI